VECQRSRCGIAKLGLEALVKLACTGQPRSLRRPERCAGGGPSRGGAAGGAKRWEPPGWNGRRRFGRRANGALGHDGAERWVPPGPRARDSGSLGRVVGGALGRGGAPAPMGNRSGHPFRVLLESFGTRLLDHWEWGNSQFASESSPL